MSLKAPADHGRRADLWLALRRLPGDGRGCATRSFATRINTPILLVAGSLDRVVSVEAVERLAGELRTGSFVPSPARATRSCMERDKLREQYWAAFDAFVPGIVTPHALPSSAQHLFMEARGRPRRRPGRRPRPAAVPRREPAAGALDDRDQRDNVVGLEAGLDDDVDVAGGDHAIGVAVAAVAGEADALLDPAMRRRLRAAENR